MSLILDALNRADQERSEDAFSSTLHSDSATKQNTTHSIRQRILEITVVLLLVAVSYFFLRDYYQSNNREISSISKTEATTKQQASSTEAIPTQPEPKIKQEISQPLNQEKKSNPIVKKFISGEKDSFSSTKESPAINALYKQTKQQIISASTKVSSIKQKELIPPISNRTRDSQSILQSIPLLSEFSTRFQRSIPSIDYSVHVYAENGGFVKINGNKFRVGGKINSKLRVIAILKDSLVLDFQGKQFRLMALNSWVNFQ